MPAEPFDIHKGPADQLRGNLQFEIIPRLQQDAFTFHQALSESPSSRLPEVAAHRMLQMCLSGNQRNLHVRQLASREGSHLPVNAQHVQDQPLPVPGEKVRRTAALVHDPGALLSRLQIQMHLRVMTQRLKMPHSFRAGSNRFLIDNPPFSK